MQENGGGPLKLCAADDSNNKFIVTPEFHDAYDSHLCDNMLSEIGIQKRCYQQEYFISMLGKRKKEKFFKLVIFGRTHYVALVVWN